MPSKPVDTAIVMVVGPCIDDTDFKSLEEAIAYDAAGMDVSMIVEKTDGTTTVTAITLTTGGTSDWTHKDGGYYEVEITAAQNAEEGIAYVRGVCTGVLPFESAHYDIVKANIYDSFIKGTDLLQIDVTQLLGTAWLTPGVAGTPDVNTKLLGATAQTGNDVGADVNSILATVDHVDHGNAKLVRSTAPANALDVSATGEAGLDFANIKNATGAHTLTNITVPIVTTTTTATNLTNAATNGDLTATMKTSVNDQVVDVIKTDTISEMAQGVPAATPTLEDAIMYIYMHWRNETTTTSSTHSLKNDAGTVIAKATISDDSTTYTKAEYVSGP